MPLPYQEELDEFLSSKGLLGETEGNIREDLDQFLKGKGLLGEVTPTPTPTPTQDIQKDLDDFLWNKGLIELGGLRRETLETEVEPSVERPGIRAVRPEEEYKGVPAWALERKLPKEMAGWSKDPKVNYVSQKIAERAPMWLLAFSGCPAIIGIFEALQQVKNITMSIKEKAKYDPLAHRMLSELIPEDSPDWLKYTSMTGEVAADMIIAAITAKKLSPKLFIKNLEAFHKKAVKTGQPAGPLKAAIERNLSKGRLRPETLDAELARAIKIRREPIATPAAMRITGEPPPEVPLTRLAAPAEAPLAKRPPEFVPPTMEVPPAARIIPPEVRPPAAMVDITPTAEGGWQIKIPQPTPKPIPGGIVPSPTIPWRPVEPELLPPHVEPPKVIKPKKPPTYKNPFYEAINLQGGVAPNADYPYSSLKELFPIGLIKKTGMPMDTLAQAMRHEFPTIESDNDLWDMADEIRRGRLTFRDERTGDEHLPPREEVEAEAQRFADREPAEMTYADFNRQIKVAIKDIKTGEVHKGKPEEIIHAQMFTRIQNKGIKNEDMHFGFALPNGQWIYSYKLTPVIKGEPTPGPKYDHDILHRELVRKALDEGKYISPEVLAQHKIDYPELFKEPVKFKAGDAVEYDTEAGVRTGEITGINEKEGIASIKTETGVMTSRNFEDLRMAEKPPGEALAPTPPPAPPVKEEPLGIEVAEWKTELERIERETGGKIAPFGGMEEEVQAVIDGRKTISDVHRKEWKKIKHPDLAVVAQKATKKGVWVYRVENRTEAMRRIKRIEQIEEAAKGREYTEAEHREFGKLFDYSEADIEAHSRWHKRTAGRILEAEIVKEPLRVAEEAPPIVTKEPSLTEIEKTLDEMAIPRIKRGVLADQIIRNYKPEISPLKTYIKSILPKITEEGELRVKPTLKRKRAERLTPELEEVIPGKAERPEDIFERAEEEARVHKIFKESTKGERDADRQRDILDRKILKGQSYDDIGKAHGITRQRAEQIFKQSFGKVKDHPDVRDIIKRKMRQANLGPIPSKRDLDDFVKFIRRYFTTTKGVDKIIDAANDTRIRSRHAEEFGSSPEGKELKKFLKKNKNDALDAFVLSALKGELPVEDTALPDNIKKLVITMRNRIDRLSQLITAHGALTEPTEATFDAGLGEYVGKFYRLHNQRRWDPPKEVRDRFKAMLKRDHPEHFGDFTEEQLDNFVNGEIDVERKYGFGTKKERRVPTDHYKRRIRLSKEWRELAGEYIEPVWLYMKTISTQAAMAYNAEFLNKIKQTYPDLWTSDKLEAQRLGWQKNQLPEDYGYGELKGTFVNKELYDYIKGELEPGMHAVAKAIQKFITQPFRATKTIFSIPTQARNFFTNFSLSFLARNSISNPANLVHYKKAVEVFLGRHDKYKKEWENLIREGVTEVQYYGSEIPKIQSDLMKLDPVDWSDKIWSVMSKPPKFIIRMCGGLYNFNDVLFRIAAYYKHTKVFKETPAQAVKEIDIALQNYQKLPKVVDILRKYPLFGPFVSFQWNMGKIVGNQAIQAGKEMKSKDPKIKLKGTLRLSRLLFVIGLPLVMMKVANEVFDIDDKLIKRLGEFLPKWRRRGNFVYFRGKEGQLKALDLTYIWPTGEIEKATRSLLKGDFESFKNSIDLLSHPIFDAWSIMIEGQQPYWGTKIPGGFPTRLAEIIKLLWIPGSAPIPSLKSLTESIKAGKFLPRSGAITPPQIKALIDAWNQEPDRYGRVRVLSEEVKGFLTGFKTFNVEPDKLLMQSIKAMRSEASELKWQLKSWIANNTKAPAWEIKDKIDDFNKRITKLLEKADEAMELYSELKKGGFLVQKEK